MRVYYSDMLKEDIDLLEYDHSIFLAGPTPRSSNVKGWRPDALKILEDLKYDGLVFVPERSRDKPDYSDYLNQVEWEKWALDSCKQIVFWISRSIAHGMPGFTTNVEFGRYIDSKRIEYGRPPMADKCDYLDWLYKDVTGKEPCNSLYVTLKNAISLF